ARYHAEGTTASLGTAAEDRFASVEHPALTQLRATGFTAHESTFVEELRYSRDDWLSMVFTYSAQLTMDTVKRAIMREDMSSEIPGAGLDAANSALLILAERRATPTVGLIRLIRLVARVRRVPYCPPMLSQAVNRLVGIAGTGQSPQCCAIRPPVVTTAAVSHSGPVHMRPEPGQ